MLFFIFVAIFVIGVLAAIFIDEWSGLHVAAVCILVVGIFLLTVSIVIFATNYIGVDASVAGWNKQYESLTYQLENNLYDNDNDIGKKELMDEIREWNEDLAYHKEIQRNFWIGIYHPNVYDNLEFIPLS